MEAKDAPDGETAAPYEPSPDGTRAKSMVAALQLDTQECLDRLDDLDARLGVDRRKVHEEYINSVRASVTTYVKRVQANPSVSADAGRGLSDLDARIAAAKAEILARQETEVEAKRRHEEMVRSVKRVDEILEGLDAYERRRRRRGRPGTERRRRGKARGSRARTSCWTTRKRLVTESASSLPKVRTILRRRRGGGAGCSARRPG